MSYQLLRYFQDDDKETEIVGSVGELEEAQRFCASDEASSRTAKLPENRRRTAKYGAWFVGYADIGGPT